MAPPTPQQEVEYLNQVAALRKKLDSCAADVQTLRAAQQAALEDLGKLNLLLAKISRADEARQKFNDAWDRLILIHIKLEQEAEFPTEEDEALRERVNDIFDNAKATEIALTRGDHTLAINASNRNESKASINLLEKIKLPHFSGDITTWARFKDIFSSMVDKDETLEPVTKFYLLRDSLSGEALSTINKFNVTATNYPLAWKALTDTYDNPRVLATAYLEQILSFKMSKQPTLPDFQNFLSDVADSVSAFQALKLEDAADKILALTMLRTLDSGTRHKFELSQVESGFPKTSDIVKFVRNHCQALKMSNIQPASTSTSSNITDKPSSCSTNTAYTRYPRRSDRRFNTKSFMSNSSTAEPKNTSSDNQPRKASFKPNKEKRIERSDLPACPFCSEKHFMTRCPVFTGMSAEERCKFAEKWKGCRNCLNPDHLTKECRSRWNCRICSERHHSLLHRHEDSDQKDKPSTSGNQLSTHCGHSGQLEPEATTVDVILGTACANVRDSAGRDHRVRLLLDSGSHRSFITQQASQSLHLKGRSMNTLITGLGGSSVATTQGIVQLTLSSIHNQDRLKISAAVLPDKITTPLPHRPLPRQILEEFRNLRLADPCFHEPQDVDILIGADYYDKVVTGSFYRLRAELPSIIPTIFGSVIMGSYCSPNPTSLVSLLCQPHSEISKQLEMFWKLEEPAKAPIQSPEDQHCEEHFTQTHYRTSSGRYVVRLPFSSDKLTIGDNRNIARRRFALLEAKLSKDHDLRSEYNTFMKEYQELGHMQPAISPATYLIPHFGIRQQKLRVVFDASCASNSSSLNDLLLSGPRLQPDIGEVITNFRVYPIAITTDIVKMYRQILLHPDDRIYQHVLWREDPSHELVEFQLNTVTYGVTSSPFQALRTIQQLLQDEGDQFPLAASRVHKRMFVDDITTGADNEQEAIALCHQLTELFCRGGFQLSKWSSNMPQILPINFKPNQDPIIIETHDIPQIKVLGLIWRPSEDTFSYTTQGMPGKHYSKRLVLSFISRIFDPLGYVAPVIFLAKVFLQQLWKNNLDWDELMPETFHTRWTEIISHWDKLAEIRIPRYLQSRQVSCRLVGFCDASISGYAAVVYLQVEASSTIFQTHLVTARTKVAPAKFLSIARLELCGAFLLAWLMSTVNLADVIITSRHLFTDSTVVLGWIHTPTYLLKTFEANRVASIHDLVPGIDWRHVRSEDNPADVASKGLLAQQIFDCQLWWQGPSWLKKPIDTWPTSFNADTKGLTSHHLAANNPPIDISWMDRFSKLHILHRTVVRILRFARRSSYNFEKFSDPIMPSEIHRAVVICARVTQKHYFSKGPSTPELASLNPFLDELEVLRVGGRLTNAPLSFSSKHQIIIPKTSHLAKLIVNDIHSTFGHIGPTLTVAILRSRYWIPTAMRFVKGQLSRCVTCFRKRPKHSPPIMAPLPSTRVTSGRAFLTTGVDYAGPITVRDSLRRKPTMTKGYICLFVCFTTKALHLEAVTSLTTEAFLSTLDRFVARRGKPQLLMSDNGTNFVGASRYMQELASFLKKTEPQTAAHLCRQGIEWRFIPPRSPHFGGLWEAGVKSVKSLLTSTIAPQPFTYEELSTILAKIEGLLNSRPISTLTEDPDSFEVLTPGHFLIGSAPCSLPEEPLLEVPMNRLTRWQLVQRNVQHLWSRWRLEYLNTMQQRSKWRKQGQNMRIGDLVVIMEKTSPLGLWPLARITDLHPGPDQTVRVVTIRTSEGATLKRSVHQLALIPILPPDTPTPNPST